MLKGFSDLMWCIKEMFHLLFRARSHRRYADRHGFRYMKMAMLSTYVTVFVFLVMNILFIIDHNFPNTVFASHLRQRDSHVWDLISADWGLCECLGIVLVGGPFVIWGGISLFALLLGYDINKDR